MTLHPYTEQDARDQLIRERRTAINVVGFQIERLRETFNKRGVVSHGLFQRLVQSVLKIGRHIPVTPENVEEFEKKVKGAAVKGFTVSTDGTKVYLEGYFDLDKLRKEVLW